MASNSEYEQRRSFNNVEYNYIAFTDNDLKKIGIIIDLDEIKKDLEDKCDEIVKIVRPKREPRTIRIKI